MERKKKTRKRPTTVTIRIYDTVVESEPSTTIDIVTHYRKTGRFRRRDLRRVLGDQTKGVSAGLKGLQDMIHKK